MENTEKSFLSLKRATVDGIATHCGFSARSYFHSELAREVIQACDAWARRKGLVWISSLGDYLPVNMSAAPLQTQR